MTYRVAWFDPEEALGLGGPPQWVRFEDINSLGEAVGWVQRPDGVNIGVLASVALDGSANGALQDLNEVFADDLALNHPGWRFNAAWHINPAGQIAGKLVPNEFPTAGTSPVVRLVVADLASGAIHLLGTFSWASLADMTEYGDVSVTGQIQEGDAYTRWLYVQTSPPGEEVNYEEYSLQKIDDLAGQNTSQNPDPVFANSSLKMTFRAGSSETRSFDPFCYDFHPDPNLDSDPRNITDGRKRKNDWVRGITEEGTIYAELDGNGARWREGGGWEPFLRIHGVSRDQDDPSALQGHIGPLFDVIQPAVVHQDSLGGFFRVLITEGDWIRYQDESAIGVWHTSISRRATVTDGTVSTDHGFICGYDPGEGEFGVSAGFILSPLTPQQ